MFEEFLYTLRRGGLKVSLTEWMSLMEALDKGLHRSSFTGFYHLCRCLLVKSDSSTSGTSPLRGRCPRSCWTGWTGLTS